MRDPYSPGFDQMREQLAQEQRLEFEKRRLRRILEYEFQQFKRTPIAASSLIEEAVRLRDRDGGLQEAADLALQAHELAQDDRNIRRSTVDIWNVYARQLLDAGLATASLDVSRMMCDLSLVDGITHRNLAVAYHNLGFPDPAIAEIQQALRQMPDYVWFHIVAAECHILKALEERHLNANQREAQSHMYLAAEQLGRAYGRGNEEVRQQTSFLLSVITATKIATDWTQAVFGGLGQLGKRLNLDQQSRREIRALQAFPRDAQLEIQRLLDLLRNRRRPERKALPEVYTKLIHALPPGVTDDEAN